MSTKTRTFGGRTYTLYDAGMTSKAEVEILRRVALAEGYTHTRTVVDGAGYNLYVSVR